MTKKDYILTASILKDYFQTTKETIKNEDIFNDRLYLVYSFIDEFQKQNNWWQKLNPRFDREKFLTACGL